MQQGEDASATQAGPRLTRRVEGRMVAGVAGGMADYAGLGDAGVRIAFVVLTLLGGLGAFLYLIAWFVIPRRDADGSGTGRARTGRSLIGAGLVAIALVLLLGDSGFEWPSSLVWGLALIAVGVVLLRSYSTEAAAAAEHDRAAGVGRGGIRLRRRARPRSVLGPVTLAAALTILGGLVLFTTFGAFDLSVGAFAALALIIVGAGSLVGSFWGRSRLLIAVGLMLVPAAAVSSVVEVPLRGRLATGYRYFSSQAELDDGYRFLAGRTTFDLTDVNFGDRTATLEVRLGAGEFDVIVPRNIRVEVSARVDAGRLYVFNDFNEGTDLVVTRTYEGRKGEGALAIDIDADLASVAVQRSYERLHDRRQGQRARERRSGDRRDRAGRDRARRGDGRGDGRDGGPASRKGDR